MNGDGAPVVVVDFLQFAAGRRASTILGKKNYGHAVYRADPVSDLVELVEYESLDEIAAGYAAACLQLSASPSVIVGYCSAGLLSLRMAEKLNMHSIFADCVLIQPTYPSSEAISNEFLEFRESLGITPQRITLTSVEPHEGLNIVGQVLAADLAALRGGREGKDSLSTVAYEQLTARHRAWISFLLATYFDVEQRPPHTVSPRIVLGRTDSAHIPWRGSGEMEVIRLPVDGDAVVTEDVLPDAVLGSVNRRRDKIYGAHEKQALPPGSGRQSVWEY